ncbi:MAG TPA: hypothetical protein VGL86_12675 [Polyangia bacterium]|jgi:hypothetical protein
MLRRTVVALLPLLMAAQPVPPPPLAEARGDVDGDGRADRAFIERDGTLVVDDADGRERARVALGARSPIVHADVRIVGVEGHVVVHARVELGHDHAIEAVLGDGGKEKIVVGPTGTTRDGDSALRLRVDDAGIVRYQTAPGFSRCDGDDLLFPERWDFAGKRFRGVTDEAPVGTRLHATATAPSGLAGPPLGLFRFTAASTDATGEARADRLGAPRELEDGNPETVWHAGFGPAAKGAWVTARTEAGAHEVRAVEIVPGKEAPKSVALILGPLPEQQFAVALGAGMQWVTLPARAATTCMSVAVLEPDARANTLGEVRVFTEVDGPAGLERLVGDVAEMRANADGAAHLLVERGLEAARLVGAALPTAQGLGRRRLLQILATIGSEESAAALGKALETAEGADRALIVAALGKMGAAGAKEAIRVYGDESQTAEARADAALVLGQLGGVPEAATALVAGAGKGDAVVRAATMQSLARVYRAAPALVESALVESSAATAADEGRVGDLARSIGMAARRGVARPEGAAAIASAWARAPKDGFALRLRLVRAVGDLGDPKLAGALGEAAHDRAAEVRAAAMTAAARVSGAAATVQAGAGDADAGVRKAALAAASGTADALPLGTRALGGDAWPMVRRTAAEALALACRAHGEARAPLLRAVSGEGKSMAGADPAEEVRRASLAALAHCAEVPLATYTAVLAEKRQPIAVRELAAALVAKHGGAEAAHALAATIDDTLRDLAAPDEEGHLVGLVTACTRALERTGDTSRPVLVALGEAANEPLSPAVRAAAMDTIGKLCPDGAAPALQRGARDADGGVQRAARAALERCHR